MKIALGAQRGKALLDVIAAHLKGKPGLEVTTSASPAISRHGRGVAAAVAAGEYERAFCSAAPASRQHLGQQGAGYPGGADPRHFRPSGPPSRTTPRSSTMARG